MKNKVIVMAFADCPHLMLCRGQANIRGICKRHGLKFVLKKDGPCSYRLLIVADDGNVSGLGQAMLEIMGLGLSLTLAPWG